MKDKENRFYINYASNKNKKETLLESCLNLDLKAEAEDILDMMKQNEYHGQPKATKNTSLAVPGALAHRLQRRTACNAAEANLHSPNQKTEVTSL